MTPNVLKDLQNQVKVLEDLKKLGLATDAKMISDIDEYLSEYRSILA